ncbi:hypothetical protein GA0115240_105825 [Streptomyces sp. DvalAA-14]|uniref:helix-turn-helix domain-containing protein n=1 Tax=unclassified Streptomyces TaxID=2593676 RepID=UPI00081AF249|nr:MULTISPECIES: helix-turn-helix domain-containing protein [unclassified Streptomyces]MYS19172.1 hypothetical protein [Streptomyces sp. SID4948]SCD38302.1 hypothetical protein GA0115240_105825 [Streptomyces sp. DvalAA-14]
MALQERSVADDLDGDVQPSRVRALVDRAQGPRRGRRRAAAPLWVRAFISVGRPVVAVTVLVMGAPAEHELAVAAGWSTNLAWGMAAVLAAYAGIAAAVAGQRRPGTPGGWTAVIGAGLSLVLAMAAQMTAHLITTGYVSVTPRPPLPLVIITSCVPAAVLAHLLHIAATPTALREDPTAAPAAPVVPEGWLTTREVAQRLGIKAKSVTTRVQRGTLVPAAKDPTLGYLFSVESLDDEKLSA